jgi:magnesium transporter
LRETHVPRIDDWGGYLYIVLPVLALDDGPMPTLTVDELDAFLGTRFLVTHHDLPVAAVDRAWEACLRDERQIAQDVDHVLYRIVDDLASGSMQVLETFDDAIERVEDEIFDRPDTGTLETLFALKRALLQLRRALNPMREVLNRLARDDYPMIDARDRVFFRDVYDHLVRMHDVLEGMRDLVSGALDMYLSVINNRMNDIMKTLTVITTVFMPISFLAGFFGMNFFEPARPLPGWTGAPALAAVLAFCALLPTAMFLWFRRRGWL